MNFYFENKYFGAKTPGLEYFLPENGKLLNSRFIDLLDFYFESKCLGANSALWRRFCPKMENFYTFLHSKHRFSQHQKNKNVKLNPTALHFYSIFLVVI